MSTRGFITFAADGVEKTTYNHSNSYPDYLGLKMLNFVRNTDQSTLRERIAAIRVVDQDDQPSAEDIETLGRFANTGVGNQTVDDWYCLLRETQGEPELILAAGVLTDSHGFPADSLFAEWGYVVDADAKTFEVYQGFQKAPHDKGRFAAMTPERDSGYFPVALVASWSLDALPTDEAFIAIVEPSDGDEG